MTIEKAFGNVLRQARNGRHLSQEKLALEANLDRTFISMLERGIRQPSLTTIFSIASVLECRASDLIARVEKIVHKD